MKSTNKRIELDWGKLLGFNQVKTGKTDLNKARARATVGAKVGAKVGARLVSPK